MIIEAGLLEYPRGSYRHKKNAKRKTFFILLPNPGSVLYYETMIKRECAVNDESLY
jgi:hypothetical protein